MATLGKLEKFLTTTLMLIGSLVLVAGCDMSSDARSANISQAPALTTSATATEQVLTLAPRAAEELRKMRVRGKLKADAIVRIDVVEGKYFRLKNGGDKRYRYTMLLDDDPKDAEKYMSMQSEGLTIQIPKSSVPLLKGTQVIWIESGTRGGFKFMNPNQLTDDEAPLIPAAPAASTPEPATPALQVPAKDPSSGRDDSSPATQTPTPLNP